MVSMESVPVNSQDQGGNLLTVVHLAVRPPCVTVCVCVCVCICVLSANQSVMLFTIISLVCHVAIYCVSCFLKGIFLTLLLPLVCCQLTYTHNRFTALSQGLPM